MKTLDTSAPIASISPRAAAPMLALAIALLVPHAAAAQDNRSSWSLNMTPVILLPTSDFHFGGGLDPEVKYTLDLGDLRVSAGGRFATYYAKDQLALSAMPTLRLMVPIGPVEPYASVGLGYGWLPNDRHLGLAAMGRLGFVYRFSANFAVGVEATLQQVDGSRLRFPSYGSMMSFDL